MLEPHYIGSTINERRERVSNIVTQTTRTKVVQQTYEEPVYVIELNQEQFDKLAAVLSWFHRTHTDDSFGPVIGSIVNKSSYETYIQASNHLPKHSF